MNEYRAIAAFSEVVRALVEVKAPLDLIGMTADFLADEARHVELASRVTMELGGAVPQGLDMEKFAPRTDPRHKAYERANEIVLRVGCIAETFSGGTAAQTLRVATHPLTRAVYETILADESRHRRFGWLYFEWASEYLDDAERARLARVAVATLETFSGFWRCTPSPIVDGKTRDGWRVEQIHELGWLPSERFVEVARDVVRQDILAPLAKIGIVVGADDAARLLA
jgi:hypothetical protein